jgi:hypothetical protein
MATIKEVFVAGDWLTAEEIDDFHNRQQPVQSLASGWKEQGLVFSVVYHGQEYYARYQFDSFCRPLPVIKAILDVYGTCVDTWSIAAWFDFPNGWLSKETSDRMAPVSPKNSLHRWREVVNAARNRKGTYVA